MASSIRMFGVVNGSLTINHKASRIGVAIGEKDRGVAILR